METYSIALRLRRITTEDAYIAVPVTESLFKKGEDGERRLDRVAVIAEAMRIGQDPRVEWQVESANMEVHPLQQAAPEGRGKLDPYYDTVDGE